MLHSLIFCYIMQTHLHIFIVNFKSVQLFVVDTSSVIFSFSIFLNVKVFAVN